MRTDHALVVAAPKRPYREVSRAPALLEHRVHEPRRALRGEYRVERMRGAERVPRGECGVERLAAGIGYVVRLDEQVVQRGVEVAPLRVVAFNLHARKRLVPHLAGGRLHCREVEPRHLEAHVAVRRGDISKRG